MSARKPDGRQYQLSAECVIGFADLVGTTEIEILELPQGSVITKLNVYVDTAMAGNTTTDIDIGDVTDPNRYSQVIIEADAAGTPASLVPNVLLDFAAGRATTSAEPNVTLTPTSTGGDPTSGSLRVYVEYYVQARRNENQGDF